MNFFMDDLYRFDAQIILPSPKIQVALYELLKPGRLKTMHDNHYSMLAYPYSQTYQNSNQWVLEILAQAMASERVHSRRSAQAYLARTGFKPSFIQIDPFAKFGAGFMKHIRFDDHPRQEQRTNHYATVSVFSVVSYLKKHNLVEFLQTVSE